MGIWRQGPLSGGPGAGGTESEVCRPLPARLERKERGRGGGDGKGGRSANPVAELSPAMQENQRRRFVDQKKEERRRRRRKRRRRRRSYQEEIDGLLQKKTDEEIKLING